LVVYVNIRKIDIDESDDSIYQFNSLDTREY
jgi:hypothetical protein